MVSEGEVIDLTYSSDPVAMITTDGHARTSPGPDKSYSTGRRKSRRKKAKADRNQDSATTTREQSIEVGEIIIKGAAGGIGMSAPVSSREQKMPGDRKGELFYVDVLPTPLPPAAAFTSPPASGEAQKPALLLPSHVSVFGNEPVEILPPAAIESDDEYIDYLDLDDRKGDMVRYFEEQKEESVKKPSRVICKNCSAEGEHKTSACPIMICLTCGARNEHSTRSCPISKTCFACGMKGHINATCPNPKAKRLSTTDGYDGCDRCGSELHKANECPTLWRLYEYLTEEGKDTTLRRRRDKINLVLGQGGEGYIADDEWCYNCGHSGHWGDDCEEIPHQEDIPEEPSAFSLHNTLSGPFVDTSGHAPSSSRRRQPREWEVDNGWSEKVPGFVGKQGRKKEALRMGKRALEMELADDDADDWFDNARQSRNGGANRSSGNKGSKKMKFGSSLQESSKQYPLPSKPPSLLERMGDNYHSTKPRSKHRDRPPDSRSSRRHDDDRRDSRYAAYAHERERDRHRRDEPGPRYRGGYSR